MTIKPFCPGPVPLRVQVTGDLRSGRLLGGQILVNRRAEISKRIDIFATVLFQDAGVEYLNDLDLSYAIAILTSSSSRFADRTRTQSRRFDTWAFSRPRSALQGERFPSQCCSRRRLRRFGPRRTDSSKSDSPRRTRRFSRCSWSIERRTAPCFRLVGRSPEGRQRPHGRRRQRQRLR